MERLTPINLKKVCYDTWELCGLDDVCKRDCRKPVPCKIPNIICRLAAYEDTGLTPEEINKIVSETPVKVSFDIGDEGFLTAINGAFKERFGITADECSKTISDLQSERDTLKKALEWIPVTERLPEIQKEPSPEFTSDVGKGVLVCDADGYVYEATFWKLSRKFKDEGTVCEPEYWMPLPKPPIIQQAQERKK